MIEDAIHLIPKWPQLQCPSVCMQISSYCLVQGEFFLNFKFKKEVTRDNLKENKRTLMAAILE